MDAIIRSRWHAHACCSLFLRRSCWTLQDNTAIQEWTSLWSWQLSSLVPLSQTTTKWPHCTNLPAVDSIVRMLKTRWPDTPSLLSMDDPPTNPLSERLQVFISHLQTTIPHDARVFLSRHLWWPRHLFLPFEGCIIAGTTDTRAPVYLDRRAPEEDIRRVLEEIRRYLRRYAVGKGIQGLVRSHMVTVSKTQLVVENWRRTERWPKKVWMKL